MIRAAEAADAAAVLALWQRARSGVASIEDDQEMIERLLESDPQALLVAEQDGEIVATLIAAWDGWRGNMYRLVVAPERRREGIARTIVEAGEERLRSTGCPRVTALTWDEDDPALGFWEAAGYTHDPHIARFARNI